MTSAIFLSNRLQNAQDDDVIGLDSVENWNVTETAKVTSHPVEQGSPATDHYYLEPKTISFTGVVSPWNFSGKGTDLSPGDFIREVRNTMLGKVPFDLFLSNDLESIPNCVITSFDYRREAKEGLSVVVDVSLQQVLVTPRAEEGDIDRFALSEEVAEQGQTTNEQGDETVQAGTLRFADSISNISRFVEFSTTGQ